MSLPIALTMVFGFLAASTAHAGRLYEDTCVECGTCDPFPSSIDGSDLVVDFGYHFPFDYELVEVEGLSVEFPDRGRSRQACFEDDVGDWGLMTITVSVDPNDLGIVDSFMDYLGYAPHMLGHVDLEYTDDDGAGWFVALDQITQVSHEIYYWDIDHSNATEAGLSFTLHAGRGDIAVQE